ncbi:hypothetical protein HS088_TW10G00720 [Tripterygium wilfordii]|uniref:Uncharacterized protein n=1 Tax=Tripterygium wilfordii TaxID=458696 RepID=A0A7J7D6L6_TRIWF|nr:uncharacterized protein LOC120007701 [Tripterygium wilfordii]KAF5741716.1 hypothetical protein HS088_TW10G00720 [Tripterygium wilfordii]
MATALACSLSVPIRSSSGSSSFRKPESNGQKPVSSPSWWTPLFGWSSDPDYLNNVAANSISFDSNKPTAMPDRIGERRLDQSRSRFALGSFTEEKAKRLRRKTLESSSFHDKMYHSAIASRLATDTPEN